MKYQGLEQFLDEIKSHCYSTAIPTFTAIDGRAFVVDLQHQGQKTTYAYQKGIKELFMAHLINFILQKISPAIIFACQNTDAKTGEILPLEQSVRYC